MTDKNLDQKLVEITALQQSHADSVSKQQKIMDDIRQGIEAGTYTTGDPVKDFCMVVYGLHDPKDFEPKLRKLNDVIDANQDQLVLFVARHRTWHGQQGCFGGSYPVMTGGVDCLGTINGRMTFDYSKSGIESEIIVPFKKHVVREDQRDWRLGQEQFKMCRIDVPKIDAWTNEESFFTDVFARNQYSRFPVHGDEPGQTSLKILSGKEIDWFFQIQEEPYLWRDFGERSLLDRLRNGGIREEYFKETYLKMFPAIDASYATALRLLDKEPAEQFKKKYDEERAKKRGEIVTSLQTCVLQQLKGERVSDSDYALRQTLVEALKFDLHKEPCTLENFSGVQGMSLNLPAYITELCKLCKIEVKE